MAASLYGGWGYCGSSNVCPIFLTAFLSENCASAFLLIENHRPCTYWPKIFISIIISIGWNYLKNSRHTVGPAGVCIKKKTCSQYETRAQVVAGQNALADGSQIGRKNVSILIQSKILLYRLFRFRQRYQHDRYLTAPQYAAGCAA
jgi:hypothetical protein